MSRVTGSTVLQAIRAVPSLDIREGDYVLLVPDGTANLCRSLPDPVAVRLAYEAGALVNISDAENPVPPAKSPARRKATARPGRAKSTLQLVR